MRIIRSSSICRVRVSPVGRSAGSGLRSTVCFPIKIKGPSGALAPSAAWAAFQGTPSLHAHHLRYIWLSKRCIRGP